MAAEKTYTVPPYGKQLTGQATPVVHATKKYYLAADVYDEKYIKQYTVDLLKSYAGQQKDAMPDTSTVAKKQPETYW